jgi:hypothetical protein
MEKVKSNYTKNTLISLILYIFFWGNILTGGFANPVSTNILHFFNINADYYYSFKLIAFAIISLILGFIILVKSRPLERQDVLGMFLIIAYLIPLGFLLFFIVTSILTLLAHIFYPLPEPIDFI